MALRSVSSAAAANRSARAASLFVAYEREDRGGGRALRRRGVVSGHSHGERARLVGGSTPGASACAACASGAVEVRNTKRPARECDARRFYRGAGDGLLSRVLSDGVPSAL